MDQVRRRGGLYVSPLLPLMLVANVLNALSYPQLLLSNVGCFWRPHKLGHFVAHNAQHAKDRMEEQYEVLFGWCGICTFLIVSEVLVLMDLNIVRHCFLHFHRYHQCSAPLHCQSHTPRLVAASTHGKCNKGWREYSYTVIVSFKFIDKLSNLIISSSVFACTLKSDRALDGNSSTYTITDAEPDTWQQTIDDVIGDPEGDGCGEAAA